MYLDSFGLKDDSLEDSANLASGVIAASMIEDLPEAVDYSLLLTKGAFYRQ